MSDPKSSAAVLWPDLTRFGLELTVAYNPSLARNFLRLAVVDRDLVTSASGLDPNKHDFFRVMRDAGFVYMPSETEARRAAAYYEALERNASLDEQDAATEREQRRLYFYSPSIAVSKELLKKFVPALLDTDFRQMPISDIKHFDYRYIDDEQAAALRSSQQAFAAGESGVFYTIPAERDLMKRLADQKAPIQSVLDAGGSAEEAVTDGDLSLISRFNTVPSIKRYFGAQALMADGLPLRTMTPGGLALVYPSYEDAVAANGGDMEGVERVQLPEALPVAFDYPVRRVLVVKDARYLEFGSILRRNGDDLAKLKGVQYHWDFLDKVREISNEVDVAIEAGVFAQEALEDSKGVARASYQIQRIRERMDDAVSVLDRTGPKDQLTSTDLLVYSGVHHSRFPDLFGAGFAKFIAKFPETCELVQKRHDDLAAEAELDRGIQSALNRVHSVDDQALAQRREDAGEKIGGARKDYARRWLHHEELSEMTLRERVEVVTKDNVWPSPDYAGMEALGVAPEVAYCIRELRNGLPTNPYRGGFNIKRRYLQMRAEKDLTLEQCENFVKAVSMVRDSLAEVKTRDDLLKAVLAIRTQSGNCRFTWHSDHWFFDGAGYNFTNRVLPEISLNADGEVVNIWYFDRMVQTAESKTRREWDWAGKRRNKSADDEANAEKIAARRERPEPEVAHLEHIERTGENFRQGKDVDENMLMEVFGFRAVEYGNWLPQDERQVVLNHSFDAFMDLSAALKLPPKAMSLGGDLALAFGSRGRGGRSAARAHYEPARNVINLTRLSGAGSLAHEWGHALDYFLAKACDVSQTHALTERTGKIRGQVPAVASGFLAVVEETRRRLRSKEEVLTMLATVDVHGERKPVAETVRGRMEDYIANLDRLLPEDKRDSVFREFAGKELDKILVPVEGDPRLVQMTDVATFVRNISSALELQLDCPKERKDYIMKNSFSYPAQMERWAKNRLQEIDLVQRQYEAKDYPDSSVFLKDAEHFDSFRSKPYWSTRVEMFARGFESWVQDRVESEPGMLSQYLVHGTRNNAKIEHSGYPRGEERERIGAAMEAFFQDHRIDLLKRMKIIESDIRRDLEAA